MLGTGRSEQKENGMDSIVAAAKIAFESELENKIKEICEHVWPRNLPRFLRGLSEVIIAGLELKAIENAKSFTEEEITTLATQLGPLRTLNMAPEVRQILLAFLAEHGITPKK